MEVSLRKPQREIFNTFKSNEGSFIRRHKKSLEATRTYWRLMSKEYNPIVNITPSLIKPFFDKELMVMINEGEFTIKPGAVLAEKKKKERKRK